MARSVKIACAVFLCSICNNCVYSKVFSRSMNDISNVQKPSLNIHEQGILNRLKREQNSNSSFTTDNIYSADNFHSQNSSVTTTEITLNTESNQVYVQWSGVKNETIFVLTRQQEAGQVVRSSLWRSGNAGTTFTAVHFDPEVLVNHLITAPADRTRTVLSDLANRRLALTSDSGVTWSIVNVPFAPHRLLPHPLDAGLILGYDLRELRLYVSEDFGRTWTHLQERVTERFFWAVPGVDADMRTVHMELQDAVGPVTYFACAAPACEPLPFDNTLGTIDFYSLVVEGDYIFVQKSTDDVTSFYVSYKRGPFRKACLPTDLQALDYNVVESDDGQVFLAVDYEGGVANLYLSDVTGQYYVMAQNNVVGLRYPGKFDVDLVKVEGLRGVYLVNKFEAPMDDMALLSQRTYITHNKGGRWRLMDAPEETREQCAQAELCNLHLHLGFTNTYLSIPLVETTAAAPGLLVAHGTTGAFLDISTSHVFVSRDAGLTWTQAPFLGNHFLSILDQGGIIAAIAADNVPTNTAHISTSEGKTWVSQNFTKTMLTVDGFVNEPGSRSLITSVFGHRSGTVGWGLLQLNYTALFERPCTDEDYEMWTPEISAKSSGQNCIMGESLEIERKQTTSQCYVGRDYLRKKSSNMCPCSAEDFECDFGYEYGADGTSCVASAWFNPDSLPAQTCLHGKYNKSVGYRKVASSACSGGDVAAFLPVETDCPLLPPRGLLITTAKTCVQRGANVTFSLRQASGSETETEYTWTFGSKVAPLTIRGLSQAASVTRAFSTTGRYNITVTAVNGKGRAEAVVTINVEDEIRSILVEIPWGARTDTPSFFNVTVLGDDNHTEWNQENSLHFVWEFKNKVTGTTRQLTWQNVIQKEFAQSGQYTFTLNVYNSVSSVFYTQDVTVYDNAITVRIHFSEVINYYNSESLNIRQALAEILCHNLAQILGIRRTRIIMSVPPIQPAVGDLTVLPPKSENNEQETHLVVSSLLEQARQQFLVFPLFTRDDFVTIMDARILDLRTGSEEPATLAPEDSEKTTTPSPTEVTHSLLAVYVSVPVCIGALIAATAMITHYKRKLRSHKKYYPIVRHRSRTHHDSTCSCGDDDILGVEELENDIIPDDDLPGLEPTLVILNEPVQSQNRTTNYIRNQRC